MEEDHGKKKGYETNCGWRPGIICIIAYVFGWVSGLIIGLSEKRSYYCVFHACQSILISGLYCTFAVVFALIDRLVIQPGGLGVSIISLIWFLIYLVLMVVCCVFAWKHQDSGDLFQLVIVGGFAEKIADAFFKTCGNEGDKEIN